MAYDGKLATPECLPGQGRHLHWNFAVIVLDASFFVCALAFLDPVVILPVLLSDLSGSQVIVGLMSALQRAGWLIPQLLAASFVLHRPRKKPFVVYPCLFSRLPFLGLAIVFNLAWAADHPRAALLLLLLGFSLFFFGDGLCGVPWHDIIGRTIPAQLRGRFFGSMQFLGGLLAVGAGAVVRSVLSNPALPFPTNYGRLFLLLVAGMTLSTICVALIREPPGPSLEQPQPLPRLLRAIPSTLRLHPRLRRVIVGQILCGLAGLAVPFYAIYAHSRLHLPESVGGLFIWAGTVGSVGASFIWAYLSDRRGSTAVIRAVSWLMIAAPAAGLLAPALAAIMGTGQAIAYLYSLVFLVNGASWGGMWIGFTNYVLEIAPAEIRPLFLGLQSTLAAPTVFMPLLGGWLLDLLSFHILFLLVVVAGLVSVIYVYRLPEPRGSPEVRS
jgi:MFS family permease